MWSYGDSVLGSVLAIVEESGIAKSAAIPIHRDETAVLIKRAAAFEPEEMRRAWVELEELLGVRGRKFFATFDPRTEEYCVCSQLLESDDPGALGVEVGTLAGGSYLRARLEGEPPALYEQIAPTFGEIANIADHDPSRPSIEFYRRRDVIDLLLPTH